MEGVIAMSTALLLPRVPGPAALLRLRIAAASDLPAYHTDRAHPAVTVASLRAARKHHLVRLSDPASCVVTDFGVERAVTIAAECGIDAAAIAMFRWGVHALVVLRDEQIVVGLLSSESIEDERIGRYLAARPDRTRESIRVRDVSTPCERLPAVDWETIRCARVGDLVHIVEAAECAYLLVVESDAGNAMSLRGLLSRARLLRQLDPI